MSTYNDAMCDVNEERLRQDALWGEQNHDDGTSGIFRETADIARESTDRAAKQGYLTWAHILNEEFYGAMSESDPSRLRSELIQVAAVAVAWVEAIDRRGHDKEKEVSG